MIVVADSGPLRYLLQIGEIHILPALYNTVVIPPAVLSELSQAKTPELVRSWIARPPGWLQLGTPRKHEGDFPSGLGTGEKEAIDLARELSADLLLSDDRACRRWAERAGLNVQGTLGLLVLASRHGITDLDTAINLLRMTNFRTTEKLLREVLEGNTKR